jgi:nitrilase
MRLVKVAGIQSGSQAFDLKGSLAKVADLTDKAAKDGAQFVVFPEAFVSGYPRHLGFQIGSRSDDDREWYMRYVQVSLSCVSRKSDAD